MEHRFEGIQGELARRRAENAPVPRAEVESTDAPDLGRRFGALQSLLSHTATTFEHGVDLAGATLREELKEFAENARWTAVSLFCAGAAAVLLTIAAVFGLHQVTESWPISLLLPGVGYVAAALVATRAS